ncbi:MAG: hypothetical protein ACYDD1_15895 [Caulobacteraceae bacterium]
MENPKIIATADSLALAAKLSMLALTAVATGDGEAVERLVAEARAALSEAAQANNDILQAKAANDQA